MQHPKTVNYQVHKIAFFVLESIFTNFDAYNLTSWHAHHAHKPRFGSTSLFASLQNDICVSIRGHKAAREGTSVLD